MHELSDWFMRAVHSMNNENKHDILVEVKSGLSAATQDKLQNIALMDISSIFSCINETDLIESEIASDILFMLLPLIKPSQQILSLYGTNIEQALAHPSNKVKRNLLNCLLETCTVDGLNVMVKDYTGILHQLVTCLAASDRDIAEGSICFFKKLGKIEQQSHIIFHEPFVSFLKTVMLQNEVSRLRIYEIMVDVVVARNQNDCYNAAHQAGFLPSLISEIKSDDPLVQLNVLELATNLASHHTGFLYLQREGVITYLLNLLEDLQNNPLSAIILPGLIDFFGKLCAQQPTVFSQQHPEALQLLFDSFDKLDPALLGVVISTIGNVGASDDGKRVLLLYDIQMAHILKKLGEVIRKKDDLCVIGMNAISALLMTQDSALSHEVIKWFQFLGGEALSDILYSCKLPFAEIRLSALQLLRILCRHGWGAEQVVNQPGILEFILDRQVEFDKNCTIAKHEVVKTLLLHPPHLFKGESYLKLKQHAQEGPFYVASEVLTSVEMG